MEKEIKFLNNDETKRLFDVIDSYDCRFATRNRAMYHTILYCGLRVSEIRLITDDCIDLDKREIYCKRLKKGNSNTLRILDKSLIKYLSEWLEEKNYKSKTPVPHTFISSAGTPITRAPVDDIFKDYCSRAGVSADKAHVHVLRHTRAIQLAEMGLDTKDIQFWLGHKNIKNTEIYFKYTTRQQDFLYQKMQEMGGGKLLERNYS